MSKGTPQPMERIENPGIAELIQKLAAGSYERVFLAEGDSWFDIFTPAPLEQPNLLGAIKTPWRSAVVDISHIGDTAEQMATPPQSPRTLTFLDTFKFDALLLSAGGNDLKDAFAEAFLRLIVHRRSRTAVPPHLEAMTSKPGKAPTMDVVCGHIATWIGLRDQSTLNRDTPVILHGYDYLQPRPAFARIWMGGPRASGPWIHPILVKAGKNDDEMKAMAKSVIDAFNKTLKAKVGALPNVHLLDTREILKMAKPGTTGPSNDWMDEIHPTPEGFAKLAREKWDPKIASVVR